MQISASSSPIANNANSGHCVVIAATFHGDGPMAELRPQPPYSYRDDPAIPPFEGDGPIAVMDGDCALCSWGARTIARLDRAAHFRICPLQSPTGTSLARHYGLEPGDPETWLLIDKGMAWSGMEAIIRIGERLGGVARIAAALRVLPRPVREWIYRRIARNRYRLGRSDMCASPDPALRARLLR
jgi:predicted DCC family thiol-disulfide oxidoreductase YuxK